MSMGYFVLVILPIVSVACAQGMYSRGGASCLNCHKLQLSHSKSLPHHGVIDCSKTSLPYCNDVTTSCSATPSASCAPADNFTCLSDGYFPDPWNCRSFHLCVDDTSTRYQCESSLPSTYKYDVVLLRCTSSAQCGFYCAGKSGVKVPHPANKNLFAFCYNGTAVLQDRCRANYELQESTQQCEAVCKVQGVLIDIDDCRWFYRCIRKSGGYWRSHEQCPMGQGFNPLTLMCEKGLSNCNSTKLKQLGALY